MRPLASILFLCLPLYAQRAQLPRKGRQPDTTAPMSADPLRKLPRTTPVLITPTPARPTPTLTPDAPLSEDRVRRLVHGTPGALTEEALQPPHILPRAVTLASEIAVALPGVTAEPIRNRWKVFPMVPWRRYNNNRLDVIYAKS